MRRFAPICYASAVGNLRGYITVKDAVHQTGVSRATLFRLIRSAGLSRYRLPGVRDTLLKRSDLFAALRPRLKERPTRR